MVIGIPSSVSSENENAEQASSQTVSATPKQTLSKIGFKRSPSHGTSLPEHYLNYIVNFLTNSHAAMKP